MGLTRNARVIFNEIPTGFPVPGRTTVYDKSQTINLDNAPLNGGVLIKMLVFSIDPYLRRMMLDPSVRNFGPPFSLGGPIENYGVGVVLRSDNPSFKKGDHVTGVFPFQEYAVVSDVSKVRILENKEKLPWSAYLGVCGMPGQTAHHGWAEYANAKKGDIVFVSAAAGSVGSAVVQIAKAQGLKVIASAGSDEKVAFVSSLGADVAFNYKKVRTQQVLEKEGPINIYWDNVGGESLEAALECSAQQARFIICGSISNYNTTEPYNVKNLQLLLWREVTFYGFLVFRLMPKYDDEFFRTFPARVAKGEIKYKEDVVRGLENAGQAILDVQSGKNFGKSIVVVADE